MKIGLELVGFVKRNGKNLENLDMFFDSLLRINRQCHNFDIELVNISKLNTKEFSSFDPVLKKAAEISKKLCEVKFEMLKKVEELESKVK